MEKQIVRDAVHIKLRVPNESPLISTYEFCYAAGYALFKMNASAETANEIRQITDFDQLKKRVCEEVQTFGAWEESAQGERLKKLVLGCRIKNRQMDEDAKALFDMGVTGS